MPATPTETTQNLRQRAERAEKNLRACETLLEIAERATTPEKRLLEDTLQHFYESQVHQIELEMQNEELHQTRDDLELSRNTYVKLYADTYDFAPSRFFTFDARGMIRKANLSETQLLEIEKGLLADSPVSSIIVDKDDREIFSIHLGTVAKRLETEIQDAREYAENIVETVREPLVVLNSDLTILTANHSFYDTFKVTPEDTIGNFIYDVGNRQWDIPKLRVLFEEILPLDTVFNDYEVEHDFPGIGCKTILLNARQIFRKKIGSHIILLAMEDITERKLVEAKLQTAALYTRSLIEASLDPLVTISVDGKITDVNSATEKITGMLREQLMGSDFSDYFTEPEFARAGYQKVFDNGFVTDYPLSILNISGKITEVMYNATVYRDEAGTVAGIFAAARDITERKMAEIEIQDARKYAESIVETVREPLVVLNSDLKILTANHSFYDTFKVTPEATIGKFIYDLGNRQWDIPKLRVLVEEILPHDTVINGYEVEHDFPGIGRKTILLNARQIFREKIGSHIILLAMEDITERKQLEAEIQDAREYAENIVETVHKPLVVLNSDLKVLTANHSFYDTFKVTPEDTIEKFIYDLGNRQWDIPKLRVLFEEILPQDTVFNGYEVEHDFQDIGHKTILLNAREIFRENIGSHIILLAMEDITERKQLEAEIQAAREYAENIVETVREPLVVLNSDLKILTANRSFYETFKGTPEATIGKFIYDLGNRQWDIPKLRVLVEDILPLETVFNGYEVEHDFQGIGRKTILLNARQIFRENIGSHIILLAMEDITERKRAEAEIQNFNRKLEQSVMERTAQLRGANQELEAFAYSVSHDLRAPLRAMGGFSQALMEDFGDQLERAARDYLDEIVIGSRHMGQLIDGLLTLSRSTRGVLHHDQVNLSVMAARIRSELEKSEPQRLVEWRIEPGLSTGGDARMIEVVMRNLLDNAWKYTGGMPESLIRVYSEQVGCDHFFCVTDNGAGFDMAHAEKLFQPFQRLHRQDEFPGIGIGLATAQRIVHRHGGTINAVGTPHKGTTFRFSLPFGDEHSMGEQ